MSLQVTLIIASALLAVVVAAPSQSYSTITTRERVQPLLGCPPGLQLRENKCYKYSADHKTHAPIASCPPGFSEPSNGQCYKYSTTTQTVAPISSAPYTAAPINTGCPPGQIINGHQCVTMGVLPQSNGGFACPSQCTSVAPMPCGYQQSTCSSVCATMAPCQTGGVNVGVPQLQPICPPRFVLQNGQCIQWGWDKENTLPVFNCKPGYELVDGLCVILNIESHASEPTLKCLPDYELLDGWCQKIVVDTNTVIEPEKIGNATVVTSKDETQHIFVHSVVHAPVNIHNVNNQTSVVNLSSTSDLKGSVVPQTRTTSDTAAANCTAEPTESKCCQVVSPRICRRSRFNKWSCFHRRTEQCSSQCTGNQIYLRPQRPIFRPYYIVLPPPPMPVPYTPYPTGHRSDCNLCRNGDCPSYCSSYDCEETNSCSFVDQESYCHENGGRACTQDFGCMGDYCA